MLDGIPHSGDGSPMTSDVTALLLAWNQGDRDALERLMPLVYQELHRIAAAHFRRERPEHTLQATALVHEAYLKLVDQRHARWENRSQFFAVAATLMRRVLVDHARAQASDKRGAGATRLSLGDVAEPRAIGGEADVDVLALNEALDKLAALDPRQARVVELRFFGGLDLQETASTTETSLTTVKRDWTMARAWLYRELGGAA
jgi:RNA polymerase sigma factor (TIGR02999 family)